ncbi:MAG TPA: DUF58 domain-containing protein [Planctomycetaceae bacterium]|nr:DUF58 domain-containing protein [Planctomycetaceae bacterium]
MPPRGRAYGRSLSQPGVLAVLAGSLLLYLIAALPGLRESSSSTRLLVLGAASLLVTWGMAQLIAAWSWPTGRSPGRNGPLGRVQISWQGIFLILIGIVAFDAADAEGPNAPFAVALYAGGAVLVFWGLRQIVTRLVPSWRAGRPRRRQMLTQPGLVYLGVMVVLFLGSLLGHSNPLMLIFALMIGAFVLNGWITYSMLKRLRVERQIPERTMAGVPVSVEIAVQNRKRLLASWLMVVTDRVESDSERLDAEVVLARVPARGRSIGSYLLRPMRRGRYTFGPLDVSTRFPLGLVERGVTGIAPASLVVYPRLGRLLPAWQRDREYAEQLIERHESRRGVYNDDFHGLREYRGGDNPRAIHWRTSARRNELMVCEYHESRDRNLTLLVDLWMPPRPAEDDRDRVELAVSFVATVCVAQLRQARDAELSLSVAGAAFTDWRGKAGPGSLESLLDGLAVVRAGAHPDIARLLQAAAARRAAGTRTVLVTTRSRAGGRLAEWDRLLASRTAIERGGDLKVVETGPEELARYFQV